MFKFFLGITLGTLLSLPVVAQDRSSLLKSSALSGSERLALYTFSEHVKEYPSAPLLNAVNARMKRQAFSLLGNQKLQSGILFKQGSASPILRYDDNVNGGNRQSTVTIGGNTFAGDPEFVAKEGIVLGAQINGNLRYAYGRGKYLDLSGGLSVVHSPQHSLEKYTIGISACSKNHLAGWTFLDVCASASRQILDLSSSTTYAVSATGTQLFSFAGFDHEASFGLSNTYYENYDQLSASTQLTTSLGRVGSISLGFGVGETVVDENSLRNRMSINYRTEFLDRPWSFSLSRTSYDGGTFFGEVREDKLYVFGINTQVTPKISAGISFRQNDSTVDFYSYDSINLNVNVTGIRF